MYAFFLTTLGRIMSTIDWAPMEISLCGVWGRMSWAGNTPTVNQSNSITITKCRQKSHFVFLLGVETPGSSEILEYELPVLGLSCPKRW